MAENADVWEKNVPNVLLIYRRMIPSIRLCGHCQMEYLAKEGRLSYRAVQERKLKAADLNGADIVLLGRLDSWYERKLAQMLYRAGKALVYIIDDDLLNIPPEISSAAYYGQPEVQRNIRAMLGLSGAVLSPSPLLLKKYAVDGKKAIRLEEPAVSPVSYTPRERGDPVKVGFAGSIDRTGDIERILKDTLFRLRREYGDRVQFEFFGAIPSFAQMLDARCIPYCDSYDKYRETLNALHWDIGLAPMPDTPFHACKHYNKFVEYAAAGVIGIFSEVEPYISLKRINGAVRLCPNTSDGWYFALKELIDRQEERENLKKRCLEYVQVHMSVQSTADELWEQLSAWHTMPAQKHVMGGLSVLKGCDLFVRANTLWKEHGFRMLHVIFRKVISKIT